MPKVSLCPSTDTFSDLTMARQGYPRMAFSACFGGIIFSILSMPGPGSWHVEQELPKCPCLQPRRAPCAVGSLERSWDPSQSPSNTGKARGVPTVQGDSERFGRGRDTASSNPCGYRTHSCGDRTTLSPQLPQLGGSSGWSVADLGFYKGKEGRGLCIARVGFG